MVHQHDALAPRIEQVEARKRADDVLVLVKHGIAAVAAFEQDLLHVVDIVRQMEADDVGGRLADAVYRDGLKDEAGDLARVERGVEMMQVGAAESASSGLTSA